MRMILKICAMGMFWLLFFGLCLLLMLLALALVDVFEKRDDKDDLAT